MIFFKYKIKRFWKIIQKSFIKLTHLILAVILFVKMNQINEVNVDSDGCFKYILIKLAVNGQEKHVVRGYGWANYHG
jgi:hypothetical protein